LALSVFAFASAWALFSTARAAATCRLATSTAVVAARSAAVAASTSLAVAAALRAAPSASACAHRRLRLRSMFSVCSVTLTVDRCLPPAALGQRRSACSTATGSRSVDLRQHRPARTWSFSSTNTMRMCPGTGLIW
jgi:hypothetical protein